MTGLPSHDSAANQGRRTRPGFRLDRAGRVDDFSGGAARDARHRDGGSAQLPPRDAGQRGRNQGSDRKPPPTPSCRGRLLARDCSRADRRTAHVHTDSLAATAASVLDAGQPRRGPIADRVFRLSRKQETSGRPPAPSWGRTAPSYSSFFVSFDMRSRRSCMSFIWRRRSSMLPSSGTGSGAFSASGAAPARGGANGLNIEKVC